jgi:hypothetical protein
VEGHPGPKQRGPRTRSLTLSVAGMLDEDVTTTLIGDGARRVEGNVGPTKELGPDERRTFSPVGFTPREVVWS